MESKNYVSQPSSDKDLKELIYNIGVRPVHNSALSATLRLGSGRTMGTLVDGYKGKGLPKAV